ncbi:MAG TPA: glycosyltransferase family 2 protein [Desulfuromonadales bacterium]|nr:glycosyltransferase family 2 protein [Desulfuromonadales bacterium]
MSASTIVTLILLLQLAIFIYFILINSLYSISNIIAFLDIRSQLAISSRQHIRSLVAGIYYRPISILVPAYNEAEVVATSVRFLLNLQFPEYEVVVINDGSSDATLEILVNEFRMVKVEKPFKKTVPHEPIYGIYISPDHPHLLVLDKENGGKADALNAGINVSQYPLFCTVDADSLLDADALMRAAKLFVEDREVVATGGMVRVLNGCRIVNGKIAEIYAPDRALETFQSVEYVRGFLTGRTAWNFTNSLMVISGAFGIFRKDIALAINGYRKSMGEDMDIVVRIHRHCLEQKLKYKIVFVPDPVCWTQVPSDWASLLRQRNRWHRGLIDCLWHNKVMLFNPRYKAVGLFAFPYFLIVEALGPAIEFTGYLAFIILALFGMLNRDMALLFIMLAIVWGMSLNLGAILLDNLIFRRYERVRDLSKLSLFAVLEYLGYRQLIVVERLFATVMSFRKGEWGKQNRKEIINEQQKRTR